MDYLLTKEQTYQLEKSILNSKDMDIESLMSLAGTSVWYQLLHEFGQSPKRICVFIGSGNNAGDALIFAIHALNNGVMVDIVQVLKPKSQLLQSILKNNKKLESCMIQKPNINDYDVIVDGIFGIGLKHKPNTDIDRWINLFNAMNAYKVAIDIPSGIDSDSGYGEIYCKVDITITFFAMKIGHKFSIGRSAQKKTVIALKYLFNNAFGYPVVSHLFLDEREKHVHKYQCGNVAVIGGSVGMEGAGMLAAIAALRSGVGLARYYSFSNEVVNIEPSIMVEQFHNSNVGKMIGQNTICVLGPGLSVDDAKTVVSDCIQKDLMMVLDAGILQVLQAEFDFNNNCILTPHIGEAAHLLNLSKQYVINNPIEAALALNSQYNTPIVLKGASTVIVFNSQISLITNGDPSLATAGSGDVLAGMIAGYIARYGFEKHVIEQAVYKHANIGTVLGKKYSTNLIASDLLKGIE